MVKYSMNPTSVLEEVELREARVAESNNNTRWAPENVASNISRSLDSLRTAPLSNNPTGNVNTHEGDDDDLSLHDSINSFYSTTTASSSQFNFIQGLNPDQGIPRLHSDSNPSTEGTQSADSLAGISRSNSNSNPNKMDEGGIPSDPEPDYGQTIRPDYGDSLPGTKDIEPIPPSRKKNIPGGVKLMPDVDSDNSGAQTRGSSPARNKLRVERQKAQRDGVKSYPITTPPAELRDLSKLAVLSEETINTCIESRYKEDIIYTCCGDVLISVNPFRDLGIYTPKQMDQYSHVDVSTEPHIYMVSARAYQDLRNRKRDQVILVSGESGAGKTETTKLLVRHVISMAGSDSSTLQQKIIEVNPLLENFGNAVTTLNANSSRFAKYLRLQFNENWMVQSGKIQDFMLEKSRVIRYGKGETTFHSFYAFLAGIETPELLYIEPGQTFRITGDFTTSSRNAMHYKDKYQQQQKVFQMLNMEKQEIEDVHVIMAAILHIGDIEFDDADGDCVIIKNEEKVQKVANLLDLDREKLTQALIQRTGTTGKGEVIQFSKKKGQAEEERDALAKALYEKLFGWLVRKINDALAPTHPTRNCGSIGILDICGFEDLGKNGNSFEQLCINIINEHLQNFMNKKIIDDERQLYEDEGVGLGEVDTAEINNDHVLDMFMKNGGILDSIDEDSKHEVSANDVKMVRKLGAIFKGSWYIPSVSDVPEFSIKHFAGKVKYDGRSFIKKNNDILGEMLEDCFKASNSLLVRDLFHVPTHQTGSISMSHFQFQGSKRGGNLTYRPLDKENLSNSINAFNRKSLKSRFGGKLPKVESDFSKRKTHLYFFRNSLEELKRSMESANPYFVRCIKPNKAMKPQMFDQTLVGTQLKYNGIAEIARIRSCNLPVRMDRSGFVDKYGDLVPKAKGDHIIQHILRSVDAQPSAYKIGKTQVFMTGQVQTFLDEDLAELRKKEEEERKKREAREKKEKEDKEKMERKRKEKEAGEKNTQAENTRLKKTVQDGIEGNSRTKKNQPRAVKFTSDLKPVTERSTPASSVSGSVYNRIGPSNSSSGPSTQTEQTNAEDDIESNDEYVSEWIDHFGELTEEEEREDMGNLLALKVIKVFLYMFLALLLLISLVIQKVSFITLLKDIRHLPDNKITTGVESKRTVAYFMLVIVICIPYAVGFMLTLLKLLFGISKSPSIWTWLWVISTECLHSFGICLLVFRVMRHLNVFTAVYVLSATAVIPAMLKLVMSDRKEDPSNDKQATMLSWKVKNAIGVVIDLLAFSVQATAPFFIKWLELYDKNDLDMYEILEIIGALVLVSANKWENFADGTLFGVELQDESWYKNKVLKIRYELQECRHYPNIIAYVIKIGLTILLAYLLRDSISLEYENAFYKLDTYSSTVKHVSAIIAVTLGAFVAFTASIGALKFQMQRFSFALPLCLATPVTVGVLYLDCEYVFLETVSSTEIASTGQGTLDCLDRFMGEEWYHVVIFGAVWLLSLLLVCRHIWKLQLDKNTNMARLFLKPSYCGILTTEQLMLNQRRHQCKVNFHYKFDEDEVDIKSLWYKIERLASFNNQNNPAPENAADAQPPKDGEQKSHVTPKLYACATMWHETKQEMVQLLKSLHRLDYDQYLRKINQKDGVYDPNYYEYEAHIFFDDAMELDDDNARVPNRWVKDLVGSMAEACSSVHGKPFKVHDPIKMATPYGGQLMWRMPGENLLFVHLKDMSKIRNRKRWSQVMYMYYLLDYRLKMFSKHNAVRKVEEENIRNGLHGLDINLINVLLGEEHTAMSNKTFILALDGDTDFNPSAIRILMQRMDEDNVGATCGRIHPIGKGPLVWYQKFEYAVGHWLQKAAEHVFGCVLCSPGCFSLFRARALMDTNIIRRYTTEPTEPGHHLQYDQGEDRWLCTLMLQRGYRIEYAAGADAWTFVPEGFNEFYNQRRRWMPSTIANILDLLTTSEQTRRVNANISRPYIAYTWLLMAMTLLGPGTILMMIAGAFQLIFKINIAEAYLWAVIPAFVYTVCCFWLKSRWQLLIAAALSIVYAFVMLIVIVGTIITATTENIFHPSVIIMVLLLTIFVLTGLCHPKEYGCLVHGFLYIIVIPSGYLLLVIFSICNLNDVSWGTREVPTKAQRLEMEKKKKQKEEEKLNKVKKGFFQKLFDRGESSITELTNLLRTLSPTKTEKGVPGLQADRNMIDYLKGIEENTKVSQDLLRQLVQEREQSSSSASSSPSSSKPQQHQKPTIVTPPSSSEDTPSQPEDKPDTDGSEPVQAFVEDKDRPRWTQDKGLGNGAVIRANKEEIRFWRGLVDTYLKPIYPTKEEKKKIADGLRELRNSSAFAFILINGFWMAFNFMFQYAEVAKVQVTYKFGDSNYDVEESVLGLSFVFLLLLLLLLQFVGMIIHRLGTLQQLLSTTKIFGKNEDVQIGVAGEIDEAIHYMKMTLGISAFDDEGCETEPPVVAEEGNPLGISVRAGATELQMGDDLGQSVRTFGTMLEATRTRNSFIDRRSVKFMDEVKKKLEGTKRFERIGGVSFRPNLPPRNNSAHGPAWHNKQTKWGITEKELRRLRPNQTVIDSEPRFNRRGFVGVGAIGRSLHQRALAIQEVQGEQGLNQNNINWDQHDPSTSRQSGSKTQE